MDRSSSKIDYWLSLLVMLLLTAIFLVSASWFFSMVPLAAQVDAWRGLLARDTGETAVIPPITQPDSIPTPSAIHLREPGVTAAAEAETAVFPNIPPLAAAIQPDLETDPLQSSLPPPVPPAVSTPEQNVGQLIIPSLGVVESIIDIPLVNGEWDISNIGTHVGLLESTGTAPGDGLAMSFIGHVTVPWPGRGPFADLILLQHGEQVVYRWQGVEYVYEVERIFRVHPAAVELLYLEDGSRINLVTCSGWDFVGREYDERLVTRAVLVAERPLPSPAFE